MGRSRFNPHTDGTVTVMEDTSLDRLAARGVSKVAPLVPPWLITAGMLPAAGYTHHLWGAPQVARGRPPG